MSARRFMAIGLAVLSGTNVPGWASFSTRGSVSIRAGVTLGLGSTLTIQATPLPGQAFFGKDLLIPVTVTASPGPISTADLRGVDIVYQLLDGGGNVLSAPTSIAVQLFPSSTKNTILQGTAHIPRSELQAIQHGGSLNYVFRARQGGSNTVLGAGGLSQVAAAAGNNVLNAPFQTSIVDRLCQDVGPIGGKINVPDLAANDGQTSVQLAAGAVSAPDTLCIRQEDVSGWPTGPDGARAISIYSITLAQTTLAGTAQLIFSYPSDLSGKVLDVGVDPGHLAIYWLNETNRAFPSGAWNPLTRSSIDTTLHTITGMTAHLSTFGLFAVGATTAAGLRPSERIITPNGDGINDTAGFSGLTAGEDVHLFDVRGRRVRTLSGPSPVWDGKDDDGQVVESGIYLYQYTSQGERVSGVIGVAK